MTQRQLEEFPELPGDWREGVEQYSPSEAQVAEAMDWLLKLRDQAQTTSPAFERWQAEHPARAFAAAEARALYTSLATPAKRSALHYHRATAFRPVASAWTRSILSSRRLGMGIAACLALVMAVPFAPPLAQAVRDMSADAKASVGHRRAVTLDDGSRIILNSGAAMDFDLSAKARHATLRHGEAYFEIAKDKSRPFTIAAGDAQVQVVGTKFNIKMDREQVLVSVTQGRVRTASFSNPDQSILITPGQQALVDGGSVVRQGFDPFTATAWRRGEVIAYRTPLRAVVRELNRYRSASIYIANGALVDNKVTGVFRIGREKDTITTLERTLGIESITLPTGQTFLY
jgi:transmembrane sensor